MLFSLCTLRSHFDQHVNTAKERSMCTEQDVQLAESLRSGAKYT